MGRRRNPLELLEVVYSFADDEQTWLNRVVESLEPFAFDGGGILAYTSELGGHIRIRSICNKTMFPEEGALMMPNILPPPIYRDLHAPSPVCNNLDRWEGACKALGLEWPPPRDNVWEIQDRAWEIQAPPAACAIAGGDAGVESVRHRVACRSDSLVRARRASTRSVTASHVTLRRRLGSSRTPT